MNGKESNGMENFFFQTNNGMKLSNLNWMFLNKGMERNENECNVTMFGSNKEGKKWNHFMIILLLDPYFKING